MRNTWNLKCRVGRDHQGLTWVEVEQTRHTPKIVHGFGVLIVVLEGIKANACMSDRFGMTSFLILLGFRRQAAAAQQISQFDIRQPAREGAVPLR